MPLSVSIDGATPFISMCIGMHKSMYVKPHPLIDYNYYSPFPCIPKSLLLYRLFYSLSSILSTSYILQLANCNFISIVTSARPPALFLFVSHAQECVILFVHKWSHTNLSVLKLVRMHEATSTYKRCILLSVNLRETIPTD